MKKTQKQAEKKNAAKKITKESLTKAMAAKAEAKVEEKEAKKTLAKAKTERGERHTVATFMKKHIMEGELKDIDIYHLTVKEFPEWASADREYYVNWYRWDLKRKGLGDFPAVEKISKRAAKAKKEPVATVKVMKGKFVHRVPVAEGTPVPKTAQPLEGRDAVAFLASLPKTTVSKAHRAHA